MSIIAILRHQDGLDGLPCNHKTGFVANLVPRALFPAYSRPAPKAREKRPGDEVGFVAFN